MVELPLDQIITNPLNQRTTADEDQDELAAMAQTITQHGVLQPVVVVTTDAFAQAYPAESARLADARWVTLIGNRRLTAARRAGKETVAAVVNDGQIGSMWEVMLVENGHRRDLAPLREAEAMRRVLDAEGISRDELAKRIGRTGAYVTQRMNLLGLIPALREALDAGLLSVKRGRDVGRLPVEEQEALAAAGPPSRRLRLTPLSATCGHERCCPRVTPTPPPARSALCTAVPISTSSSDCCRKARATR